MNYDDGDDANYCYYYYCYSDEDENECNINERKMIISIYFVCVEEQFINQLVISVW